MATGSGALHARTSEPTKMITAPGHDPRPSVGSLISVRHPGIGGISAETRAHLTGRVDASPIWVGARLCGQQRPERLGLATHSSATRWGTPKRQTESG